MPKLKTETDTSTVEREVRAAAAQLLGHKRGLKTVFEHGQWWVTCPRSGAIWSVVDAEGPGSHNGLAFEVIEHGDEG